MTLPPPPNLDQYIQILSTTDTIRLSGRVVEVVGLTIEALGLDCQIGEICQIYTKETEPFLAEVVGFRDDRALLMPLGEMRGLQPGGAIYPLRAMFRSPVGKELLGRVLNGLGQPIDELGSLDIKKTVPIHNDPPHPLSRQPIRKPLITGIRSIDGMLTCGKGQRMGIFSGSGVGKSTLLGTIARNSKTDVSVIALVGERGREVQEFIDQDLGPQGLARSVIVVSTSDQPALVRLKAAWIAMTIAEYFRDQGLDVTFLMDSVTRFAMAQREIGLAIGEPPASKGYPPSVFALLPKLLERAGTSNIGTITGFFSVLVEGDDFNEPICDAARSILDGHIMLTRELATRNHYPAIDVLQSISRVMPMVTSEEHQALASHTRLLLAAYEKARDLINIGAYVEGSDPEVDAAIEALPQLNRFLQQGLEFSPLETTLKILSELNRIGVEQDGD
jgi:flagellum-specific ATP synthase